MQAQPASRQSLLGLNVVNLFLAEVAGVIVPFLSDFLRQHHWQYDEIGLAVAVGGLGTLLMQTPAGVLIDRIRSRRFLLGFMSLLLGFCYGILPLIAHSSVLVNSALFLSGIANAFFVPLLGTLALALVGRENLAQIMGTNQSFNHAGNIAAAVVALVLVHALGLAWIFYVTVVISVLATSSLLLIRKNELNEDLTQDKPNEKAIPSSAGPIASQKDQAPQSAPGFRGLLCDPSIRTLLISVALFHLANAPTMLLVALYLKHLGGGDEKVAWVVLVAQTVMVPVALFAGKYCAKLGRKPVFAVAFIVLPIRILLYSITKNPTVLLAIQALDGIGAGIYGVVIALMCSDLTRGKPGFNTLMGMAATALAVGGVIGPLLQGVVTQHLGFPITFLIFGGIAALGAIIFLFKMPETWRPDQLPYPEQAPK